MSMLKGKVNQSGQMLMTKQAAQILGVSTKTVYRMEDKGLINSIRTPGGQRRFSRERIEDYLKKSKKIIAPQNPSKYKKGYKLKNDDNACQVRESLAQYQLFYSDARYSFLGKVESKGCELLYSNKLSVSEIIQRTPTNQLIEVKKASDNRNNNMLIHGDNLIVLKTLCDTYDLKGKVNLIYIDPPFATGQNFLNGGELAYSDKLINYSFLEFLRERLIFMNQLLSANGSIYVHIDLKIGHYVKIIMDEIFGHKNFRNDITRIKCNPKNFERKAFGNIKDVIYFYSKSSPNGDDKMIWQDHRESLSEEELIRQFPKIDNDGRKYATTPLHAKGETINGPTGQRWKGLLPPKGRHWRYLPEELTRLDEQGLIEWSSTGNPRKKIYAHENKGKKIQDIWEFKDPGFDRGVYPTEKNYDLLKRIIKASSRKGDLVMDCFCGSGTTCQVASELGRRWIGVDSSELAIKEAQKKLSGSTYSFYKAESVIRQSLKNLARKVH